MNSLNKRAINYNKSIPRGQVLKDAKLVVEIETIFGYNVF